MIVEVKWIGTASIYSYGAGALQVYRRAPISGTVTLEVVDEEEAGHLYDEQWTTGGEGQDDPILLDIDYMGGSGDAANPNVIKAEFTGPENVGPDDWEFHSATVLTVTRDVGGWTEHIWPA